MYSHFNWKVGLTDWLADGLNKTNLLCPIVMPFRHNAQCHRDTRHPSVWTDHQLHPGIHHPWDLGSFWNPSKIVLSPNKDRVYTFFFFFFNAGVHVDVMALCVVNYNEFHLSSSIWNAKIPAQHHQNEMSMNMEQWFSGDISLNCSQQHHLCSWCHPVEVCRCISSAYSGTVRYIWQVVYLSLHYSCLDSSALLFGHEGKSWGTSH